MLIIKWLQRRIFGGVEVVARQKQPADARKAIAQSLPQRPAGSQRAALCELAVHILGLDPSGIRGLG